MPFDLKREKRGWKVVDDKGREYSRKPLTKKRATAQLKALYSAYNRGEFKEIKGGYIVKHENEDHKLMYGEGFFSDVYDKVKKAVRNTVDLLKRVPPIRKDYPPNVRALLSQYGNGLIVGLTIRREPIQSFINKALGYITSGKWDKAKRDANYDNMFHLSLVADIKSGTDIRRILIEKNEVINMSTNFSTTDKQTLFPLATPNAMTLMELMNGTRQRMGDENFFKYDAFTNNCQNFVLNLVETAGVMTPEAKAFILQPVEDLLKGLPSYTPFVARAITDLGALANRVIYGEGACCEKCAMGQACKSSRGGATIVVGGKKLRSIYIGAKGGVLSAEDQKELLASEGFTEEPSEFKKPEELVKRDWEDETAFKRRKLKQRLQTERMEEAGITPADQKKAIMENNIKRLEDDIKAIEDMFKVKMVWQNDPDTIRKLKEIKDRKDKDKAIKVLYDGAVSLFQQGKDFISKDPKGKAIATITDTILKVFGAHPDDDAEREAQRQELIRLYEQRKKMGEEYQSRLGSQLVDMRLKLKGMKDGLMKFKLANKGQLSAEKKFKGRDATGKPIYEGSGPAGSKVASPHDKLRTEAFQLLQTKKAYRKSIDDWEKIKEARTVQSQSGVGMNLKPSEREMKARATMREMTIEYGPIDTAKANELRRTAEDATARLPAVVARLAEIAREVSIPENDIEDWASGRRRASGRKKGGIKEDPQSVFQAFKKQTVIRDFGNRWKTKLSLASFRRLIGLWEYDLQRIFEKQNETEKERTTAKYTKWFEKIKELRGKIDALMNDLPDEQDKEGGADLPLNPDQKRRLDRILSSYKKRDREIGSFYDEVETFVPDYIARLREEEERTRKRNEERRKRATERTPADDGDGGESRTPTSQTVGSPTVVDTKDPKAMEQRREAQRGEWTLREIRYDPAGSGKDTGLKGYTIINPDGEEVETITRGTRTVSEGKKTSSREETDAEMKDRAKLRINALQQTGRGMDMKTMAGGSILSQLKKLKVPKTKYLGAIRSAGSSKGYDPKKIQLSDDGEHKIMVVDEEGKKHYAGRVGYGDFHIWSVLESKKDVPTGYASQKQKDYLARATKIKGDWKKDKYSPNSLAIALLW